METTTINRKETKMEIKKEINCMSCGKNVETTLIPFGEGHVAVCPNCRRLAYNKDSHKN